MSIGKDDVIFSPAVASDYCLITVATIDERKSFIIVAVDEGQGFPSTINDEKDIFLEVFSPNGGKVTAVDLFETVTELRVMKEIYLPVRIRYDLYGESEEFFSQVFSKVITSQYDDFPQSHHKH